MSGRIGIVIDASSLAKYVLKEPGWREVRRVIAEHQHITTVDHAAKEVLNAIWKRCILRGDIDSELAHELCRVVIELFTEGVIEAEEETRYLDKAFEIALKTRITIYDALYIAQAHEKGYILLTSDKKQGEAARKLGIETIIM